MHFRKRAGLLILDRIFVSRKYFTTRRAKKLIEERPLGLLVIKLVHFIYFSSEQTCPMTQ